MFRNRNNSQKLDEELIRRFQQTFPHAAQRRGSKIAPEPEAFHTRADDPTIFSGFDVDMVDYEHKATSEHDIKLCNDWTPRKLHHFGFSSPWLDLGWISTMSTNQHLGLNTPNSCKLGAILHNQAGDLHTPTIGVNIRAPLSLPNVSPFALLDFRGSGLGQFGRPLSSQRTPSLNTDAHLAAYAPSSFMQLDSGNASHSEYVNSSFETQLALASNAMGPADFCDQTSTSCAKDENFRYNVSLQAPTAMVKHARENPETYLNKGQPYTLTVIDSTPPVAGTKPIQYRTFIRISFEGEEEKSNPEECWKLWVKGRRKNEAHQRGGELLAVEYVDTVQGGGGDNKKCQIELRETFLDGFCVTWTANPSASTSDCSISVRFNFLSTDFSLSKGVKGIPVRLCVKTELLSPTDNIGKAPVPERCHCKVKLFRDHGAERKLSNDLAHVNKTIEKLENQIVEMERGTGSAKRKRGNTVPESTIDSSDHMAWNRKDNWSTSPQLGALEKMHLKDGLQAKLANMQDMLSSTRSVSVLDLPGSDEDDPDFYPIRLSNNGVSVKIETHGRQNSGSSFLSLSDFKKPPSSPHADSSQVSKPSIGAMDINQFYRAPFEPPSKAIACFYIRFAGREEPPRDPYHATYLMERTVRELIEKISAKRQIDPKRIVRILHINQNGVHIMVDDHFVRELPEGQDMIANICDATGSECHDANHRGLLEINLTY